jgi:hypothetical protein
MTVDLRENRQCVSVNGDISRQQLMLFVFVVEVLQESAGGRVM